MRYILVLVITFFQAFSLNAQEKSFRQYVDPGIGTAHSRWFFYTPAAVPFGMAKPAPCTDAHLGNPGGWEAVGYDGRHRSIEGFANFHEFQIGGVKLAPTVGEIQSVPGPLDNPDLGYRSRFRKETEFAEPGYYSVMLDDYSVKAELTATPRVAFHRYSFPETKHCNILFDIGNKQGESGPVLDASVRRSAENEIEGMVTTLPVYVVNYQSGSDVKMYFVAQFDKIPDECGTFRNEQVFPGETSILGPGAGMYLHYHDSPGIVTIKIGLSYTSIENARLNLLAEAANCSFDEVRQHAEQTWDDMLGRISVSGAREADVIKFYTALYHALLGRGLASDCNGHYPKNTGGTGRIPLDENGVPRYNHYNTDAMWGTFWNLTQLWALAYPDYYNEFIRCNLDHYRDCGWLPDSTAAARFVSGVGTNYMGLVVASAYLRGIRDYDIPTAYEAVLKNEIGGTDRLIGVGKIDLQSFLDRGYSPYLETTKAYSGTEFYGSRYSASHTLEYSFSCFAAANFARALGNDSDAEKLMKYSENWRNLFDSETKFIRPRDIRGEFLPDFDPKRPWNGFQEGNSWQYTFYVPHDPQGLIDLIGRQTFNDRLDDIFQHAEQLEFGGGKTIDAFAGLQNLYNHGNQPSLHISWLFNYGGRPWMTQHWVRRICDVFYGTEPIHGYGYGQDEDQGQLGAWFVLAGIGLFDVQGGTALEPTVQISSPLFDSITIQLDQKYYPGKTLKIQTRRNHPDDIYIQSVKWNGQSHQNFAISWENIIRGGTLEINLGSEPNTSWGTSE